MCGVFGFISSSGSGPNMNALRSIAIATETRGRHACGLSWIEADGVIRSWKRKDAFTRRLSDLDRVENALALIGHCRWATHGSFDRNENNHPHKAGRGYIVHNGQVENYLEVANFKELELRTECDSEVIAHLMSRGARDLRKRASQMAELCRGKMAVLGLFPSGVVALRRDNPLCFSEDKRGTYLASLPTGMPGKAWEFENYSVASFKWLTTLETVEA